VRALLTTLAVSVLCAAGFTAALLTFPNTADAVTTTTAPTTTAPTTKAPSSSVCARYASPDGNDSAAGSRSAPFATVLKLEQTLTAGQAGCLKPGTYTGSFDLRRSAGTQTQPITITSSDPSKPATIFGRVVTHPGADWLTLTDLNFNWNSGGQNVPSITIGSEHISLTYDDIQNQNTAICVSAIDDPIWGVAKYTLIDHDRIHNCGQRPVASYSSPGYFSHGVYVVGYFTTITNNYIYDNSNRGIQLRGSQGAVVEHNTIDGNGSGVIFGDLTASNNEVAHNIITNSSAGCACNTFGVLSWWGTTGTGTGNSFHDNCVYGNQAGDIDTSGGGFVATANRTADPQYVNRAGKDFRLATGSPCADAAPAGTPGPGPRSTSTSTTTARRSASRSSRSSSLTSARSGRSRPRSSAASRPQPHHRRPARTRAARRASCRCYDRFLGPWFESRRALPARKTWGGPGVEA
jgi:parallel beta-helix repeat protein